MCDDIARGPSAPRETPGTAQKPRRKRFRPPRRPQRWSIDVASTTTMEHRCGQDRGQDRDMGLNVDLGAIAATMLPASAARFPTTAACRFKLTSDRDSSAVSLPEPAQPLPQRKSNATHEADILIAAFATFDSNFPDIEGNRR